MDSIEEYNYVYPGTNISIKDVQKVELEILDELDRICKLRKIPYQLACGTLLGAVRHKGFIPWDDDIDVFMKRNDYERFLKEGSLELCDKYSLQSFVTDPDSVVHFVKLRKKGTVYAESGDSSSVVNKGIWIDIFPLDNVKPGTIAGWYQRFQVAIYYAIITSSVKSRIEYCQFIPKKLLRGIFANLLKIVPKKVFDKKLQTVLNRYNTCETGYLAFMANGLALGMQYLYVTPSDGYYDMTELEFCGKMFPVPRDYDAVLKRIYGNYMKLPSEEKRYPEHEIVKVKI